MRAALPPLLSHAARLVLDADALNALAADPALQPLLRARAARGLATLLTPHPLEAARLLQTGRAEVQRDRLAAARQLAADTGAAVLLKGSGSVIAAPAGRRTSTRQATPHWPRPARATCSPAGPPACGRSSPRRRPPTWPRRPPGSMAAPPTCCAGGHRGRCAPPI